MGPIDRLAMIVVAAIHISGFAHAGAADKTQALVDRAVAHIHDVGREQAFADFDRPDGGFVDGELYIFCLDAGGVVVANGASPTVIGHNLIDVRGPDGRLAVAEVIRLGLSQGGGWLEYRWPNPATRRIELKDAYVLKVDDRTVCGSGFYKGDLP
ncbi:MAG TPA: cache domain-containing protein [Rhodopila sp.]|jgi:cytochrome c|nr:cache domain-containing protein [Rhodopila sp.]